MFTLVNLEFPEPGEDDARGPEIIYNKSLILLPFLKPEVIR